MAKHTPVELEVYNFLTLAFKYLYDLNQIKFLMTDVFNIIVMNQKKKLPGMSNSMEWLVGAWVLLNPEEIEEYRGLDGLEIDEKFYEYVVYPTARSIIALSAAKGIPSQTFSRGLSFLSNLIQYADFSNLEPRHLSPVMDAILSVAISGAVPYDKIQNMVIPLADDIVDIVIELDPELSMLHTHDIIMKYKKIKGYGLDQRDLEYMQYIFSYPILKYVLKAISWMLMFDIAIPSFVLELTMDLLISNYGAIFDVHKDPQLVYYISNAETLAEILKSYSDKKFAQIILDRTVEYVSESILRGVSNIYQATKLLLISKILIESRAIIRR